MARAKKGETEGAEAKPNLGTHKGKVIRRLLVNLGTGGEIVLNADDPPLPGESVVTFEAEAVVGAEKYKFRDDGGVDEAVILTVRAASFRITGVEEKTPDPQLPGMDGEEPDGDLPPEFDDGESAGDPGED